MKEKENFKNTLTLTAILHLKIALGLRKFIVQVSQNLFIFLS